MTGKTCRKIKHHPKTPKPHFNENYNISLNFKKLFGIYNIKIYNKYWKYFD